MLDSCETLGGCQAVKINFLVKSIMRAGAGAFEIEWFTTDCVQVRTLILIRPLTITLTLTLIRT